MKTTTTVRGREPPLPEGADAPAFSLKATPDQTLTLEDFAGSPVVLVFYPADFSPVCTDELAIFNELLPDFEQLGARVVGISVDSVWCHLAFCRERRLHFPLVADFYPHGEVSKAYRSFNEREGVSDRTLFVIDGNGKVFWSHRSPVAVNPGADGVLDALERLTGRAADAGGAQEAERQSQGGGRADRRQADAADLAARQMGAVSP